jgi:hypothetical protein
MVNVVQSLHISAGSIRSARMNIVDALRSE